MLSPDSAATPVIAAAALIALLAWLMVRATRKDKREYSRFKRYRSTARRQTMYRKWVVESFLVFGGSAVVVSALVWQHIPIFLAAFYDLPSIIEFGHFVSERPGLVTGIVVGAIVAITVVSLLAIFLARNVDEVHTVGDIAALLPRNRAELKYGALLSINAGVVEELLFRLAMPVLIYAAVGDAAVAVAASIALFGLLHIYQGPSGVIGSMVIGALLMALFLGTGSILLAVLAHALIDLRSLVLIPVMVYRVHTVTGGSARTTTPAAR